MFTLKEAGKIALEKHPGDTIVYGFEYKNLYIFQMLVKGADLGSTLNYHVSIDKNTENYEFFDIWDEGYEHPDEFFPAFESRLAPEKFM